MAINKKDDHVMNVEQRVGKLESAVATVTADVSRVTNSIDKLTDFVKESHLALSNKIDNNQIDALKEKKTNWVGFGSLVGLILTLLGIYINSVINPIEMRGKVTDEITLERVRTLEQIQREESKEIARQGAFLDMLIGLK
jgi:hypothetical protein